MVVSLANHAFYGVTLQQMGCACSLAKVAPAPTGKNTRDVPSFR